jgi:outer membrane protein
VKRRTLLLLLAPAALSAQTAPDAGARAITLEEAIKLAQRNAPSAVQARGAVRSADASIRASYGAFFPTLSLNSAGSKQGGETFFQGQLVPYRGDPWSFSRGVSSNLQLFDGGRRLHELRTARADASAAVETETVAKFRIALDVKVQFYAVQAARESESAALVQLEQAQQQLQAASARVAAGTATKSDSLRAIITVGNAQLAVLTARNGLRVASASLTRLVGTNFPVTAAPTDTLAGMGAPIDSLQLANLVDNGPAIRQARAQLGAAKASTKASRTPYMPTLSTSFNYSGSNTANRFDFGSGTYAFQHSLRFTLSYPVFDNFNREEAIVRANVAEDNAEASLRDARLLAQQSLVQYIGALRTAEARAQIQSASVAAAEEDLRVQQQRYNLGASTFLDVLTSQVTLNQARAALIQARFDARTARAQIESLIGQELQ